jgi:hypothetical protein
MISTELQSAFNDSKLVNKPAITIHVEVSSTDMIDLMAKKLMAEFERMAPYAGYAPVSDLTSEDIARYLRTLLWLRVCTVLDTADKSSRCYQTLKKSLAIPVLMYQLLICIGRAYDSEFNLEFMPAYSITEEDLLSPDEMAGLSSLFRSFENSGMKVVYGVPFDREGELDFMAMSHVDDVVVSYKRSHPSYAFLASFVRQQKLNEVTGLMSRVIYGYDSDYKYQLEALLTAING